MPGNIGLSFMSGATSGIVRPGSAANNTANEADARMAGVLNRNYGRNQFANNIAANSPGMAMSGANLNPTRPPPQAAPWSQQQQPPPGMGGGGPSAEARMRAIAGNGPTPHGALMMGVDPAGVTGTEWDGHDDRMRAVMMNGGRGGGRGSGGRAGGQGRGRGGSRGRGRAPGSQLMGRGGRGGGRGRGGRGQMMMQGGSKGPNTNAPLMGRGGGRGGGPMHANRGGDGGDDGGFFGDYDRNASIRLDTDSPMRESRQRSVTPAHMMGDLADDRPYGKQEPVPRNLSKHESQMALDFNKPMSISRRGTPDELDELDEPYRVADERDRPLPGGDGYGD